jgi:hypothetical protein
MDDVLVSKSKELGFNLSKTFENHLKHLINNYSTFYTQNNYNLEVKGSPGEIRTPVEGSKGLHDCRYTTGLNRIYLLRSLLIFSL